MAMKPDEKRGELLDSLVDIRDVKTALDYECSSPHIPTLSANNNTELPFWLAIGSRGMPIGSTAHIFTERTDSMKATGIVRRIDDLGRVVIPKEIRRTMRIREGDPLEIYTSGEGEVIFKKYSPVGEMQDSAESAADVIHKLGSAPVVIFDRDHVVATAGVQKKEYAERRISQGLEELLETRKSWVYDTEGKAILPVEGVGRNALAVSPIIASGDLAGAVCFLNSENQTKGSELQLTLAQTAAMFLGRQLEA